MNDWLNTNADGIALALIVGLIALALLIGAFCVERLVEPRSERGRFRNLASNTRGRRAMGARQ